MAQVEHLKMIQAIITRMAGNSFLLKGWAVTLVAGLTAFAAADADRGIAWIACGVVAVFGTLDAYYLALERSFRELYDLAAGGHVAQWSLKPATLPGPLDVLAALGSFAVWPLYGAAAIGAGLVAAGI